MELFILCWFWQSLWTKAVVFHLTLGYMFPPLHSSLKVDHFTVRRASGSSGDGPSASFDFMEKSDPVAGIKNNY